MRQQTQRLKVSLEKGDKTARSRSTALYPLHQGEVSIRQVAKLTWMPRAILALMTQCLTRDEYLTLRKMLTISKYEGGVRTILTAAKKIWLQSILGFLTEVSTSCGKCLRYWTCMILHKLGRKQRKELGWPLLSPLLKIQILSWCFAGEQVLS